MQETVNQSDNRLPVDSRFHCKRFEITACLTPASSSLHHVCSQPRNEREVLYNMNNAETIHIIAYRFYVADLPDKMATEWIVQSFGGKWFFFSNILWPYDFLAHCTKLISSVYFFFLIWMHIFIPILWVFCLKSVNDFSFCSIVGCPKGFFCCFFFFG